jgi:hypothetical protein
VPQVFDHDRLNSDDLLGSLTLPLVGGGAP